MKIFILGQIGVRKSTLIKELSIKLPGYKVLCVDDFRKRNGDGTWSKENLAKLKFVDAIDLKGKDQIIEAIGGGKVGEMLKIIIPKIQDEVFIFLLKASDQVRLERLRNRKQKSKIPFLPKDLETMVRNSKSLDHLRKFALYGENIRYFEVKSLANKSNIITMLQPEYNK